jgi:RNA polymerase sigma factor (sigma-70 family)
VRNKSAGRNSDLHEKRDRQLAEVLDRLARRRDDPEAWEALYRLMRPVLYASCYRSMRGVNDLAEDATQETFLRLFRYARFPELRSPQAFRAYAQMVARNVGRSSLREALEYSAVVESYPSEVGSNQFGAEGQTDAPVLTEALRADLLAQLDVTDRLILQRILDGFRLRDISRELGLPYQRVGVRLHRLRKRLRKWLENRELSDPLQADPKPL